MRHRGVTMKLNPLREVVRGKRLTVVDDSIVRGTTTKQIVRCCARPAPTRSTSGSARRRSSTLLLRHRHPGSRPSSSRRRARRGDPRLHRRDSLGYLSIKGVLAALDLPYDRFCFACFDGRYPEPVPYDASSRQVHARRAFPPVGEGARRVRVPMPARLDVALGSGRSS
jgi:amidophosphoribosyltransferase